MIDQQYSPLSQREQPITPHALFAQREPAEVVAFPQVTREMITFFLDFSPDALVVVNAAGTIALVNSSVEMLFGYRKEELVGQPLEVLLPKRLRAAHAVQRAQYMSDPHPHPVGVGPNLMGLRKDGREFPVDISLQPIRIEATLYVTGAIRDMTAQREAQREREQLTERLRLQSELINLARDAILVHDPEGHIVSWNRGAEDLYGWTEQEAAGQLTQRFLKTRFPLPWEIIKYLLEHDGHWHGDLIHTCRDGKQVLVESRWALIRDEQGTPTAFLEINRDVTERRRLEQVEQEARAEMNARLNVLQLILNCLPCGVFLVQGTQARLILANRAASELWGAEWQQGQSMEDFFSQKGVRLYSTDGRPFLPSNTATGRALEAGEAIHQRQAVIRRPDGTSLPVLVTALPLDRPHTLYRLPSPIVRVLAASERVVLVVYQGVAALREAEALKDQFISLATHELRTPVTVIAGYADLVLRRAARGKEHQLDAWQTRRLQEMKQATQRLAKLTEDLLDATRVQAGQFQLHPCPTDLVSLTWQVIERLQTTTTNHRISLDTALAHLWADVDAERIEQVLSNLLSNAIKYSPQGGPVEVTLEKEIHTHEVRFRIRDEGMGIPREQQAHLFRSFVRADNVRSARISGTGLGLYLCRELVERHGGRIWFESNEGLGTTFFFVLPSFS